MLLAFPARCRSRRERALQLFGSGRHVSFRFHADEAQQYANGDDYDGDGDQRVIAAGHADGAEDGADEEEGDLEIEEGDRGRCAFRG